jgi:tRNA wybutosine-synthesizing protein 3
MISDGQISTKAVKNPLHSLQTRLDLDQSPKGFVDEPIIPFMNVINRPDTDYETTSSCSGRIAIFAEKKDSHPGFWLFVTHDEFTHPVQTLFAGKTVELGGADISKMQAVWFKFEPFILHIACPNAALGQDLLNVVFECGYRTSGLINGKKRCMVQIKDTLKMDAPIGFHNPETNTVHLVVDFAYIDLLVQMANTKFKINKTKLDKLLCGITAFLAAE